MTIDSADDSKISNRTINTNRISNRTYVRNRIESRSFAGPSLDLHAGNSEAQMQWSRSGLRSTWQSSVIQASTDVQDWDQLTVGSSTCRVYADFIWWQVVCHRWSTHLEQPTRCHPRLVSVILNIRKTVEIILVCLTIAAPVIFNWRLTNALTN